MLKLKYLIEDMEMTKELLNIYECDDLTLLDHFRISSNIIYPFRYMKEVRFIRITPAEEKNGTYLLGELALLKHLEANDFPCVRIIESINNRVLEEQETVEGMYYTSVFKGVPGDCVDGMEMSQDLAVVLGKSLGKLHVEVEGVDVSLPSYVDVLDWAQNTMLDMNLEKDLETLEVIKNGLSTLSKDNFGIVHFDYEPDNLFYDGKDIYAIDFNDAMYHFYTMDIVNALNELPKSYHESFLSGYQNLKALSKNYKEEYKWCELFVGLYKNTRIKRSILEPVNNEPKWMVELRKKLASKLADIII